MKRKKKDTIQTTAETVEVNRKEMQAIAPGTKGWRKVEKERPKYASKSNPVYQEVFCEYVFRLNLLGATIRELAEFFNVTPPVIHRWRKKYPKFSEAFEKGKDIADSKVAEQLYRRAIGYSHPEEKVFIYRGQVIRETVIKHYPPDTGAAAFWLKNRRGDQWKDKHEHNVTNRHVLDPSKLEQVTDDQLNEIVKLAGGPEFNDDWEGEVEVVDEETVATKETN